MTQFRTHSPNMQLKMFMSFFTLLFIVIVALCAAIYVSCSKNLDAKTENYEANNIRESAAKIDVFFNESLRLAASFESNTFFTRFFLPPKRRFQFDYKLVQQNIATLNSLVNSSYYVDKIMVYYENSGYILDNLGLWNKSLYGDLFWLDVYASMDAPFVITETYSGPHADAAGSCSSFALINRIPYGYGEKYGAVVIYMNPSVLGDILDNTAMSASSVYIVNEDGGVICSNAVHEAHAELYAAVSIPTDSLRSSGMIKNGGPDKHTILFCEPLSVNDWILVHMIPDKTLYYDTYVFRNAVLYMLLVFLLLSAAAAVLLSKRIYTPLRALLLNVNAKFGFNGGGDLAVLEKGFNQMSGQIRGLEKQLEQYKEKLREMFLSNLADGEQPELDGDADKNGRFVADVKAYIENGYGAHMTLAAAAKHFNYNASYFSRMFKEKTGMNFSDYVTEVRGEEAKKLLRRTSVDVDEIAARTGYNNKETFIKNFKKNTGQTPNEYRAEHQRS